MSGMVLDPNIIKLIVIFFAIAGFGSGFRSATLWWRASQLQFNVNVVHGVTSTGPFVTTGDIEPYLKEVSRLNGDAAAAAAVSILSTSLVSFFSLLGWLT